MMLIMMWESCSKFTLRLAQSECSFILAKNKTPPFEQTKNSKGAVKNNGKARTRFRMGSSSSKAFKNYGLVLDKLMNIGMGGYSML